MHLGPAFAADSPRSRLPTSLFTTSHHATRSVREPLRARRAALRHSQRGRPPRLLIHASIHPHEGGDPSTYQHQRSTQPDSLTLLLTKYQLRYCPALAKKPTNPKTTEAGPKPPKPDPFKDPSPDLLIASFPPENPTHALVLNKFPVIPNHFILATRAWKPQTDLLEPDDLHATYACLQAWPETSDSNGTSQKTEESSEPENAADGKRLFAFFNSGDESGASQPHRHLQFLPVEAMRADSQGWAPLIDLVGASQETTSTSPQTDEQRFKCIPTLPFKHFALPLPPNPSPETLHGIYLSLYRAAVSASGTEAGRDVPSPASGPAAISYNLAMTLSTMMICPRTSESALVPVDPGLAGDIVDPGVVALNGTILAGTLMVKAEAEWDRLRAEPVLLGRLLRDVGVDNGVEVASL